MKISIITACYNRATTIVNAIHSVLTQDYHDIEYIIVDGASTDGSQQVIEKIIADAPETITVKYISEPDHGMYEAINKGIRMATGDVVGLVHSDDVLSDNHVISDIAAELQRSGADFLYGDGVFVDAHNTNHIVRNWKSGKYSRSKVRWGWLPLHPTCYVKRNVIQQIGLYDEQHYRIAADTDWLVLYLWRNSLDVTYLHRRIITMRLGGLSTDASKRKIVWQEDIQAFHKYGLRPAPLIKILKMVRKIPQYFSLS